MPTSFNHLTRKISEKTTRRSVATRVLLAEKKLVNSRFAECESVVREILAVDPKHLGALEVLSKCLWRMERYEELNAVMTRMIAINPYEPGYFSLKGMTLRALGRYGEAARCLAKDPSAADMLRDLEAFQANLVRDLIASDPLFAVSYSQNPEAALVSRGFHFEEQEIAMAWVSAHTPEVRSYARLA